MCLTKSSKYHVVLSDLGFQKKKSSLYYESHHVTISFHTSVQKSYRGVELSIYLYENLFWYIVGKQKWLLFVITQILIE